jgi:site-specific recombinase XerD
LAYLGERARHRLETLDERDIVGFQKYLLADGRAESTVQKLMKYLREPITLAAESGKIARNPFALVPRLRAQSVSKERFTTQDVAALVKAAKGTEWEGLVLLGYSTGMRLMDAVSLRHSDIDGPEGVIVFEQRKLKNKKSKKRPEKRAEPVG